MTLSTLNHVRFAGMTSCVPKTIISNEYDCPPNIRSERKRLIRNIGINTRRKCFEWQNFSDLALAAAQKLIDELNWKPDEIDALIVVSQSPDYRIPATAIILQDKLGLPKTSIAFDVNLGCSGYPFGLKILGSLIETGAVKKGLLLVGDKGATFYDPIFSDAGTATALEYCSNSSPIFFDLNSDGSGYRTILLPVGGHKEPYALRHLIQTPDENHILRTPDELILDGVEVLNFTMREIPGAVENILSFACLEKNSIDYYFFHQANRMINNTLQKKLKLDEKKVPSSLGDFGNTSGASIPVTMTTIFDQLHYKNKKILLSGFGVGLSWGSCILDIESAAFPKLLILE